MADNDRIGTTIAYYRIDRLLGRGGMATVYQATDVRLQRQVALKIMHSHLASQEQFQQSFLREAEAIQSLEHPNIIKVYAFDQIDDELFIVMELIEGGGLRGYMKRLRDDGKRMEMPEAIELTRQIADALHYAHQQGMIHRDVKPDNILLRANASGLLSQYQAILTDFGLAKLALSGDIFITSQPVGTYPYMSPEQCRDERVDVRSDVYSLGISFYELVAGRLPFTPRSLAEATRMHTREAVPRPSSFRPDVPSGLEKIILKSLEKDPNNRYQTAGDFSHTLQDAKTTIIQDILNQPPIPDTDVDGLATNLIGEPAPEPMPHYTPQPVTEDQVGYDRVVIFGEDYPTRAIPVRKNVITLGSDSDRDIPLDGKGVSRRHARIERSADGKYRIVDLRSTNGTWLEDARLIPNVAEIWEMGRPIRIGDYWIRVEPAASRPTQSPESITNLVGDAQLVAPIIPDNLAVSPGAAVPLAAPLPPLPPVEREKIVLKVDNPVVRVEPGSSTIMQLSITNMTQLVEHFTIQANGLPPDWVTTPPGTLELLPGDHDTASITFHPPRNSSSTAGEHAFEIRVVARAQGLLSVATQGTLVILPYPNFISDLQPQRILGRGISELQITNTGNTYGTYNIYPRDKEQIVKFSVPGKQYTLPPGHTEYIDINVSPRRRHLIGNTRPKPFEVSLTSRDELENPKAEPGELVIYPYIPLWLIIALLLLLALCFLLFNLLLPFLTHQNEVTQTAVAMVAGTSAAGTSTANAPTITPTATGTDTPTPTLTPFPTLPGSNGDICPGSPSPTHMQIGIVGRVTLGGLPNRLRDNPGKTTGTQIGLLQPGTVFSVIDGPQCDTVDQLRWWKVTASGAIGWTAEGEHGEYYLEPLSGTPGAVAAAGAGPAPVMQSLQIPAASSGAPISLDASRVGIQIDPNLADADWTALMSRVTALGVGWLKVQVSWKEMQPNSATDTNGAYFQQMIAHLKDAHGRGLKILVSLDKAPDWARANHTQDGPPDDPTTLGVFMTLFLNQAGDAVDAIEIWNEPNLAREWQGALPFNGAGYMSLFNPAYQAIRAVSPTLTIITAGLAPTENSNVSVDDREYLTQMYAAGLKSLPDIAIGVHPYGWSNAPDAVCCGSDGWNSNSHFFFNDTLGIYRGAMVANGQTSLRLFVTEFGWGTWDGLPGNPPSGDEWMKLNTESQQAAYTLRAFQIGEANDFVGPMMLWNLNFGLGNGLVSNGDERAAYSILLPAAPNDPANKNVIERGLFAALHQALTAAGNS